MHPVHPLPVRLSNTLKLILLLDGVGVAAALGGVDELLSCKDVSQIFECGLRKKQAEAIKHTQALRDGLHGAERALAGANGDEGNGSVDTAEGRNIDGLATDGTGGTNTGGVLTGTAVDDGINSDLDGVGVGGDVDLKNFGWSDRFGPVSLR